MIRSRHVEYREKILLRRSLAAPLTVRDGSAHLETGLAGKEPLARSVQEQETLDELEAAHDVRPGLPGFVWAT